MHLYTYTTYWEPWDWDLTDDDGEPLPPPRLRTYICSASLSDQQFYEESKAFDGNECLEDGLARYDLQERGLNHKDCNPRSVS